jgi:aryl-alcohol dehydrogenase-like predicted oxidoreductase
VALGVNFVDTADAYGPGTSERLLAETLDLPRDDVFVATKGGLLRNRAGDWIARGDPDYLRNAHLCSLDRLGVETIDLTSCTPRAQRRRSRSLCARSPNCKTRESSVTSV